MNGKVKSGILLTILLAFSLQVSSQQPSVEDFYSQIKNKQDQIDLIRQGVSDAYYYLGMDNIESAAYASENPQAYVDLTLLRFYSILSTMNFDAANKAGEVASFISNYPNNGVISRQVIDEGVAKLADMRDFFLEYANQQQNEFNSAFEAFCETYGFPDQEVFNNDNLFMEQYGVNVE